jgi:hypothetical protein
MDNDAFGVTRGCLFALEFNACLIMAVWMAWRLLRATFA